MAHDEVPGYTRVKGAIARLTALFVAMPGSRMTVREAAQLSGVDDRLCRIVLEALTDSGFLSERARGVFVKGQSHTHES
jgi:predicted transcriptional regulator of viral defense system